MQTKSTALAAAAFLMVGSVTWAQPPAPTRTASASFCRVQPVSVDGQAQVPAQEAGVLTAIQVREGDQVSAGQALAQIDDTQARKQKRVSQSEHQAADAQATNDIDIRHATTAAEVAKYEYKVSEQANQQSARSITDVMMRQLWFEWQRTLLAIEQAKKEQLVNGFTAEAKLAEMEAADDAIERRKIKAPIDGVVQRVFSHVGEWVQPGDPLLRLIRMDRLQVEGKLPHDQYRPADLVGQPVTVEISLDGGQEAKFPGRVVFVDPELLGGDEQRVYAVVENRKQDGQWLLRPGMKPEMTIQLR